jgi:large subunit ribosomal protein L9
MKVFLIKDVEKIGMAGDIIKVSNGFAVNFLFPRKLAVEATAENEVLLERRMKVVEERKESMASQTSVLAEKIKSLTLVLKRKMHEDKLYGAVSRGEVVDLLVEKNISVSKDQILFDKSIKTKGVHVVTVKLSSKLQPSLTLKIVPE